MTKKRPQNNRIFSIAFVSLILTGLVLMVPITLMSLATNNDTRSQAASKPAGEKAAILLTRFDMLIHGSEQCKAYLEFPKEHQGSEAQVFRDDGEEMSIQFYVNAGELYILPVGSQWQKRRYYVVVSTADGKVYHTTKKECTQM